MYKLRPHLNTIIINIITFYLTFYFWGTPKLSFHSCFNIRQVVINVFNLSLKFKLYKFVNLKLSISSGCHNWFNLEAIKCRFLYILRLNALAIFIWPDKPQAEGQLRAVVGDSVVNPCPFGLFFLSLITHAPLGHFTNASTHYLAFKRALLL